jgi:hypothetical protein
MLANGWWLMKVDEGSEHTKNWPILRLDFVELIAIPIFYRVKFAIS